MPDNFHPADQDNPYADYGPEQLYAYLKSHGVAKPEETTFAYSNLGVGLLGQALAERAGRSYPDQLREEITGPLGMADTVIKLSADQQRRFMQGHDEQHRPVHAWDLDALAGAGANSLHGGRHADVSGSESPPGEICAALPRARLISPASRAWATGGQQIALAWLYAADTETYWHDGATAGFTSDVFFNPREDCAAVVLLNTAEALLLSARLDRRTYPAAAFGRAGHVARYRAGPGDHGISGRVAIVRRLLVHHAGGWRVYLWRGFGSAGLGGAATAAAAISASLGISATGGHLA